MPNYNGMGPMGQGPLTGRRMGRCNASGANQNSQNSEQPKNPDQNLFVNTADRGFGFGWFRCGRGRGLGRQNRNRNGS